MTKNVENIREFNSTMEVKEIINSISNKLPSIARDLIENNQDLSNERNQSFLKNPDDLLEHEPKWHQWGIITHTRIFEKSYKEEIPKYLNQWGIYEKVQDQMSKTIDGISKNQLLDVAILFHDLGKFTERKIKDNNDNYISFSFKNHEIASGKIIRSFEFSKMLKKEYCLTDLQIEYIARCAELHYEFSAIRDEAIKSDLGYSFAFLKSNTFNEVVKQFNIQHSDFQLEMGILYLADSLAKTDIRIEGQTDKQIETQNTSIQQLLKKRRLNEKLIKAVKQLPINCSATETYLKFWADLK